MWPRTRSCGARSSVAALNDVLEVQEEIARRVTEKLQGTVIGGTKATKATRKAVSLRRYTTKLMNCFFVATITQQWTPEGLQRGIELYRQAIDADPRYAPAYACMAIAYAMLTVVGRVDTAQAFSQAKACARQAIELDETLSEAHAALCLAEVFCDFNLAEALCKEKERWS